jgi:hypothetical protein
VNIGSVADLPLPVNPIGDAVYFVSEPRIHMVITGYILSVLLVLLPEILALTLLIFLVRHCFSTDRNSPCLWVCGTQVALSVFLIVTSWRTFPGPVISISTDIFPTVGSIALLVVSARAFRQSRVAERIGLSIASFASIGVLALVAIDIEPFWSEPFARGAFLGW